MKFIKLDNISYEVLGSYEDATKLTYNKAYTIDDIVYIYRGSYESNISNLQPGIYTDKNGDGCLVEYIDHPITIADIEIQTFDIDSLISKVISMPKIEVVSDYEETNTDINKGDPNVEYLRYHINDNDDDMTRMVKDAVNKKYLQFKDIDYNMVYALRIRNTMTYSTLMKWCKILDMKLVMYLTDNEN